MDSDLPGQGVLEAENLKSLDILGFSAHSPLVTLADSSVSALLNIMGMFPSNACEGVLRFLEKVAYVVHAL